MIRGGWRKTPREDWEDRWKAAGDSVGWEGAVKGGNPDDGFVALKTSPIWEALGKGTGGFTDAIGAPYPPFAFGSGLGWVNVSRREMKDMGINPDEMMTVSVAKVEAAKVRKAMTGSARNLPAEELEKYHRMAGRGVVYEEPRLLPSSKYKGTESDGVFYPPTVIKPFQADMTAQTTVLEAIKAAETAIGGFVSALSIRDEEIAARIAEATERRNMAALAVAGIQTGSIDSVIAEAEETRNKAKLAGKDKLNDLLQKMAEHRVFLLSVKVPTNEIEQKAFKKMMGPVNGKLVASRKHIAKVAADKAEGIYDEAEVKAEAAIKAVGTGIKAAATEFVAQTVKFADLATATELKNAISKAATEVSDALKAAEGFDGSAEKAAKDALVAAWSGVENAKDGLAGVVLALKNAAADCRTVERFAELSGLIDKVKTTKGDLIARLAAVNTQADELEKMCRYQPDFSVRDKMVKRAKKDAADIGAWIHEAETAQVAAVKAADTVTTEHGIWVATAAKKDAKAAKTLVDAIAKAVSRIDAAVKSMHDRIERTEKIEESIINEPPPKSKAEQTAYDTKLQGFFQNGSIKHAAKVKIGEIKTKLVPEIEAKVKELAELMVKSDGTAAKVAADVSTTEPKEGTLKPLAPDTGYPSAVEFKPSAMKVVKANIGGTTGAKLVEWGGKKFIMKTAERVAPEHVRNEAAADQAYRAAGINVPDCRVYEVEGKVYKLSSFIDGGVSLGEYMANASEAEKEKVRKKLLKGYALDALFANWDVLGTAQDNVLIDRNGEPWRIDNGSAFGFRAQGAAKKQSEWKEREWIDEWRTLRTSGINKGVFDKYTARDIFSAAREIDFDAAVANLPEADRKALEKPLKEMKQMVARCADFDDNGFTNETTSDVLEHSYDLSKQGFRESCPKKVDGGHKGFGYTAPGVVSEYTRITGKGGSALPSADSFAKKVFKAVLSINAHIDKYKDFKPNQASLSDALAQKSTLQKLSAAGDANAKYLLGVIAEIENSSVQKFKVKIGMMKSPSNLWVDQNLLKVVLKPSAKLSAKYSSVTDHSACYIAQNWGNWDVIPEWQKAQASDSWNYDACKMKYLMMLMRGKDIDAGKGNNQGVYTGWGESKQSQNWSAVKDYYKKNPKQLEVDLKSARMYKAAMQLYLENTDMQGRDEKSRTILLLRTENGGLVKGKMGEPPKCDRGTCESCCCEKAVYIKTGSHPIPVMSRVPYSRVNAFYFNERNPGAQDSAFLGDGEAELNADFSEDGGITSYVVAPKKEYDFNLMTKRFLDYEKRDGKTPRS